MLKEPDLNFVHSFINCLRIWYARFNC